MFQNKISLWSSSYWDSPCKITFSSRESWAMWYNTNRWFAKKISSLWKLVVIKSRFEPDPWSLFTCLSVQRLPGAPGPVLAFKNLVVKCISTVQVWSLFCACVNQRPKNNSSHHTRGTAKKSSLQNFFLHSTPLWLPRLLLHGTILKVKTWWASPILGLIWHPLPSKGLTGGFCAHSTWRLWLFLHCYYCHHVRWVNFFG